MSSVDANLACPACRGALQPAVLQCRSCGVRVEGSFQFNEFASLGPEDLHLLRIFVLSEGRIRDMEAPLGLSYPTIRTRLAKLRERISPVAAPAPSAAETVDAVLERLERQELSFEDAMDRIRAARGLPPAAKKRKSR